MDDKKKKKKDIRARYDIPPEQWVTKSPLEVPQTTQTPAIALGHLLEFDSKTLLGKDETVSSQAHS